MHTALENLNVKDVLKKANLKVTPQRILILEVIKEKGHATIEHIYNEVKKQYPSISIATVYKNIHNLYEKGVLREINPQKDKAFYEITVFNHSHFICTSCHNIYDIEPCENSLIQQCFKNVPGKISELELNVYGICDNCKSTK